MFGRRKVPVGSGSQGQEGAPPPPGSVEPFPTDKMNDALEAAIKLFTQTLEDAGVDIGGLAMRGDPGPDVTGRLASCTTYRSKPDQLTYLALGITPDFKQFMYPPHCRLFMIINSTGICEDPAAAGILRQLAPAQLPSPLVDAHLMRQWVRFIRPTGEAMSKGQSLDPLFRQLVEALISVIRLVPPELFTKEELKPRYDEFVAGFPGTIGYALDDSVRRMNGLPVTPFIAETLTKYLAELQMRGLSERR